LKVWAATLVLAALRALPADEPVDLEMVTRIRQEGFRNSKVMETSAALTDWIGARLTGSPEMKRANDWARQQLADWGLANAHLESWGPFGRGWTYESASVRMVAPTAASLVGIPKAWTPGTSGPVRGEAVKVKLESEADLEKQRGKLAGKILLLGEPKELKPQEKPAVERYDEKGLQELYRYEAERRRDFDRAEFARRRAFRKPLAEFLSAQKVLAVLEPGGGGDGGTFDVQGSGFYKKTDPAGVPMVVLAAEHYGRLNRLLESKRKVEVEVDVRARYHDEDAMAYNTIAEIPGTDKGGEVVMIGAHMDSWHGGTGATDNAAGVAAVMEAVRILKALEVRPRRTVRIALWSGEEQGLLGSRAYVAKHFASRPPPKDPQEQEQPYFMRRETGPLTIKPDHAKLSVYFNMDNGTGKIRGIYAQENAAVVPVFEAWLRPLQDLGATTVTMRNTSSTDHTPFDAVGLPGFQFIQDDVEYSSRSHHSNADLYERLQREDLIQASVVIATFAYHAAMRDRLLPRKPLPKPAPAPARETSAPDRSGGTR
jgi:carboxypeptidase Q